MRIGIILGVIGLFVTLSVHAQKSDSIKSMLLPDVVVTETYQQRQAKKSALTVDVADQDFCANILQETSCRRWRIFPEYRQWILVRASPNR